MRKKYKSMDYDMYWEQKYEPSNNFMNNKLKLVLIVVCHFILSETNMQLVPIQNADRNNKKITCHKLAHWNVYIIWILNWQGHIFWILIKYCNFIDRSYQNVNLIYFHLQCFLPLKFTITHFCLTIFFITIIPLSKNVMAYEVKRILYVEMTYVEESATLLFEIVFTRLNYDHVHKMQWCWCDKCNVECM